ncbi:MAG TPA: hypothetical protein DCF33_10865 [Saprospirales bacterium]|nr:hypothetical protein [Saprospirales bacterium]
MFQLRIWYVIGLLLMLAALSSCAAGKFRTGRQLLLVKQEIESSKVYANAHTGFVLMDANTGETLVSVNDQQLFTPASCTKILTLATSLEYLGDSLPSLEVARTKDQRWLIRGKGDPTFLHPDYQAWQSAFQWMKAQQDPLIVERRIIPRFGKGWAWDDYNDDYSAERSDFPYYGNIIHWQKTGDGQWMSTPKHPGTPVFEPQNDLYPKTVGVYRLEQLPYFLLSHPDSIFGVGFTDKIPIPEMSADGGMMTYYLPDTLGKSFDHICYQNFPGSCETEVDGPWRTLYSTPRDTVLRQMMYISDNFLAEQLLLMCADRKFGALKESLIIQEMQNTSFASIVPTPRWVDGSGLSRYNLISPGGLASVLKRLWDKQPKEKLLSYFPYPGGNGPFKDWPTSLPLHAKTGGMSGVACLSGYLRARSGKMLIFSLMHNNFTGPAKPYREESQRILQLIYERF